MESEPLAVESSQPQFRRSEDELLDWEEMRVRLKQKTVYAVKHFVREKKIPVIELAPQNFRFYWPDVVAALRANRTRHAATPTGRKGRKLANSVTEAGATK